MTSKIKLGGFVRIAALIVGFLTLSAGAWADGEHPHPEHDLAKASQNPVAKLISVPFENNATFNNGPEDVFVNILNIKPVIPTGITENFSLINRIMDPETKLDAVHNIGVKDGKIAKITKSKISGLETLKGKDG